MAVLCFLSTYEICVHVSLCGTIGAGCSLHAFHFVFISQYILCLHANQIIQLYMIGGVILLEATWPHIMSNNVFERNG